MSLTTKAFASGSFLFELDDPKHGGVRGHVKSVSGGLLATQLIEEASGGSPFKIKHVGKADPEPITLEVGFAESGDLLAWISDFWQQRFVERSGAITHFSAFNAGAAHHRVQQVFREALITEVSFPAWDAEKSDGVYLTVKIQPRETELKYEPVGDPSRPGAATQIARFDGRQKLFSAGRFVFLLDDIAVTGASNLALKQSCRSVKKVEGLNVSVNIQKAFYGAAKSPELVPTGVTVPDLSLTLPLGEAKPFFDWNETSIQKGVRSAERTNGEILYLTRSGAPLFSLTLRDVGLKSVSIENNSGDGGGIAFAKVDLHCDQMDLKNSITAPKQ